MYKYKLLQFTSHNSGYYFKETNSKKDAIATAKMFPHCKVEDKNGAFEDFENGELVSWSYPNGLGQIKINQ